jgi:hypothetical protein
MQQENNNQSVGALVGFTFGDWMKLTRENHFSVSRTYWKRWATVTLLSLRNSRLGKREAAEYDAKVEDAVIQPPLFVLGHWRSGTTLLHSLLVQDDRFAYPNLFQVTFPHIFLSMEEVVKRDMARAAAQKRSMDNVQVTVDSPGEDEFALASLSLRSPILGWMFSRRETHYDRYLSFRDVSAASVAAWKATFIKYMKKLSWRYQRPLILKSPPHTARVRLLLEMFPDARFVHVSRNPYDVYRSTRGLYSTVVEASRLQPATGEGIISGILRRYQTMYDAYLEDRKLIPEGHLCEIRYADLETDMVTQVNAIYEQLQLGDFAPAKAAIQTYSDSVADYQKNTHKPLAQDEKRLVAEAWGPMFEAFGYEI